MSGRHISRETERALVMQRLVVEVSARDLTRFGLGSLIEAFEMLEVIHYLKFGDEGFAGLCRIRPRPGTKPGEIMQGPNVRLELLAKEEDSFIVYMEIRPTKSECTIFSGVYLCAPPELRGDLIRISVLGEVEGIKTMLDGIEEAKVGYRIHELTDASIPPNSPMSTLTERQREILVEAYRNGYYEVPRRINSEELANRLKLDKSTVVEHLRKAENRLVSEIILTA